MKKYLLAILIILSIIKAYSQDEKKEKEPHYLYATVSSSVYTNATGSFNQKLFFSAEFGQTFGIFDIGLAVGRLNSVKLLKGEDSVWFSELRPTINVFSKGRFSEALTLGAGFIFGANQNFLTEVTNSINFVPNNKIVLSVFQGNYFFDGKASTSKAQFMGFSITINFIKKNTKTDHLKKKSLLN